MALYIGITWKMDLPYSWPQEIGPISRGGTFAFLNAFEKIQKQALTCSLLSSTIQNKLPRCSWNLGIQRSFLLNVIKIPHLLVNNM